jgi:hypothetical protein
VINDVFLKLVDVSQSSLIKGEALQTLERFFPESLSICSEYDSLLILFSFLE